jgi:hypothetical protein
MPTRNSSLIDTRKHLCGDCLNPVSGVFCTQCGQRQKSSSRHFRQIVGEWISDVLNLDAKILRTLKPLFFRPGFLSTEFFADRRTRYVSPLKLYFFISLVAFFFIQQEINYRVQSAEKSSKQDTAKDKNDNSNFTVGKFNDKPWNAKTNPVQYAWLPNAGNDLLNEKLLHLERTVKNQEWSQIVSALLAGTPQTLLIMLPFFALILKLAYAFQRRLYVDHLIVAVHHHAFLLLAILLMAAIDFLAELPGILDWLPPTAVGLVFIWMPFYFLLSLKRVYKQSWKMTGFKFMLIGFAYLILLTFGVALNFILGLLWL